MSSSSSKLAVVAVDPEDAETGGHITVQGVPDGVSFKRKKPLCNLCSDDDFSNDVDARLQLVLSTREETKVQSTEQTGKCLIFPHNPLLERFWDPLVMLMLIFTAVVTPFEVAFVEPGLNSLFVVNQVVNILFFLDTVLVFFVPQFDRERGVWITSHAQIARRYLAFWFWIDIVSVIPFDAIALVSSDPELARAKAIRLIRLLRLIKLLRLLRASRLISKWEESMPFKYATFSLLKFGLMLLVLAHWMSCLMGIIPVLDGSTWDNLTQEEIDAGAVPVNWIVAYFEGSLGMARGTYNMWSVYLAGLYYSLMTLTTIGYGDVVPKSDTERGVILVLMLIGGIVYAYAIGSVFSTISSMNEQANQYKAEKDELADFMDDIDVPFHLRAQVLHFLRMQQPEKARLQGREIMKNASVPLQTEVAYYQAKDWINELPFFTPEISPSEEREAFTQALALEFELQVVPPSEVIVTAFDDEMKLCVIIQGSVMLSRSRDYTIEPVDAASPTSAGTRIKFTEGVPDLVKQDMAQSNKRYFGAELLVPGAVFPYFVTTLGFTQMYILTKTSFESVLDRFPLTRKGVMAWCAARHVVGKGKQEVMMKVDPKAEVELLKKQLTDLTKEITALIETVTLNGKDFMEAGGG